jgi:hypothetical protein
MRGYKPQTFDERKAERLVELRAIWDNDIPEAALEYIFNLEDEITHKFKDIENRLEVHDSDLRDLNNRVWNG